MSAVWTCECGKVEADVPVRGVRLVCYCESCRGFVERFGKGERLDPAGGSDLLQVDPGGVVFRKGTEHLRYMKLTAKGPHRWYAACCGTPMANTLGSRFVAFASFQVADIAPKEGLPDVAARVHQKGATAYVDAPKGSVWPMLLGLLGRSGRALLTGGWRRNPFFDTDGTPIGPQQDAPVSGG